MRACFVSTRRLRTVGASSLFFVGVSVDVDVDVGIGVCDDVSDGLDARRSYLRHP